MDKEFLLNPAFLTAYSELFRGCEKKYAKYSKGQNGKKEYYPQKEPLTDGIRFDHFQGNHRIGVYVMSADDNCYFIAADIDNKNGSGNPAADAYNYWKMATDYGLEAYILNSMSCVGYHVYIFFELPVSAWKARTVAQHIADEAGLKGGKQDSFDRFFPAQDKLSGKRFGNLIALPFHGNSVLNDATVFVEPSPNGPMLPVSDQVEYIAEIKTVSEADLDEIINEYKLHSTNTINTGISSFPELEEQLKKCRQCKTIEHCIDNPNQIDYLLWYRVLSNVSGVRPNGFDLCHAISKGYDSYSFDETQKVAFEALNNSGPVRCKELKKYYDCEKSCGVTSPFHLISGIPGVTGKKAVVGANLEEMKKDIKLFTTKDEIGYAEVSKNNNREIMDILGEGFKYYIEDEYMNNYNSWPSNAPLGSFIERLNRKAKYGSEKKVLHHRVAQKEDSIYIDLCRNDGMAIEINPKYENGWLVIKNAPVYFKRNKNALELPIPIPNGNLGDLRNLLNCKDDDSWKLIIGWMIAALIPSIPFPLLLINGEAGSGKSTMTKIVHSIIDPSENILRAPSEKRENLFIAAHNTWLLSYDNYSSLHNTGSDDYCIVSTGGTFSSRKYYSNNEEVSFYVKRPVILNGINNIVRKNDLLDRSIVIELPAFEEDNNLTEVSILNSFNQILPGILGCLYSSVAMAIKNYDKVDVPHKTRMMDFVTWVTAAEESLGWQPGDFSRAYRDNKNINKKISLSSDPLAKAIIDLMENRESWKGLCGDLLNELKKLPDVTDEMQKSDEWPKAPNKLSARLKEMQPELRSVHNIYIKRRHVKAGVEITINRIQRNNVEISTNGSPTPNPWGTF